jgi:hypothetical protein
MAYFGGSKAEQAIAHGLLEVTSPEAALTGNDVTLSHVTGSYVTTGCMFCVFPRFFLTIVVVQNVPLRITGSSMVTGCDVTESDVTGIDVISPKVGDCSWGVILIVRGVVWYSNGVLYHVRVPTVVSLLNNLRAGDRGIYTTASSADRWICTVVAAAARILTE